MAVDGVRRPHARDAAWDSAFYRFAEGVRALTGGQVNYKILYAMVGTNGRYVNHVNAIVRKRTAAAFSRLIHSSRYALDFQEAYRAADAVFALAAAELVASLRETTGLDDAALTERLLEMLDEGVVPGLANERSAGRTEVNLARLDCEASSLAGWCRTSLAEGRSPLEELAASIFHMVAFGHLDERFARMLLVPTPLDAPSAAPRRPAPPPTPPASSGLPTIARRPWAGAASWTRAGPSPSGATPTATPSRPTRSSRASTAASSIRTARGTWRTRTAPTGPAWCAARRPRRPARCSTAGPPTPRCSGFPSATGSFWPAA